SGGGLVGSEQPAHLMSAWWDWPRPKMFGDEPDVPHTIIATERSRYGRYRAVTAVAGDAERVYVMINTREGPIDWSYGRDFYSYAGKPDIAYLKLDSEGRPRGTAVEKRMNNHTYSEWDGLHKIPQPEVGKRIGRFVAKVLDGKLYLATMSGMFIYDPKK